MVNAAEGETARGGAVAGACGGVDARKGALGGLAWCGSGCLRGSLAGKGFGEAVRLEEPSGEARPGEVPGEAAQPGECRLWTPWR